jgi:hypothetical protein
MLKITIMLCILFSTLLTVGKVQNTNFTIAATPKELSPKNQQVDSLKWSINFLNKLLFSNSEWYLTDNSYKRPMQSVLSYAQSGPLDTVVVDIRRLLSDKNVISLIDRRPQDIRDLKNIPGYLSDEKVDIEIDAIRKNMFDSLNNSNIVVPLLVLEAEMAKAPRVPEGDPVKLLGRQKELPGEFITNLNEKIAALSFPPNMTGSAMDSTMHQLFITYREAYNDSMTERWRDQLIFSYRSKAIAEKTDLRIKAYKKLVQDQNYAALVALNDKTIGSVNDSLKVALQYLTDHAAADSARVGLINLTNDKTELWTANREMKPIRMFLKNAQHDSLSVLLVNNGKGEVKLIIDDGVKLTRFSETQNRTVTFQPKALDKRLQKYNLKKVVYPAWTLVGNGSLGFTQTSLSNWAKGGESSLALLAMSKYNANYSKKKLKWENSAEFRYGISQSKSRGLEKNDDKIEFQSRFGYSAFKKWYYSGESNFRTQLGKGYKFPDRDHPISAFMAPGFWTMSVGLDYKPNKDFSLFLSPFTSKTTFIRDTSMIAPSKYGLEPGTKKLWEPGIIVKANWHRNLAENITYDTKGEFFNNYRYTFRKFAFEWEQVFIMQVNRFINARVITQVIYDYNTKFPILDAAGKVIALKPKVQFKELFTIGFTYKF